MFDRELEEEVARPTKRRRVGRTVIVAERRIVIHGEVKSKDENKVQQMTVTEMESKDENKVQEVTETVEEMAETVTSVTVEEREVGTEEKAVGSWVQDISWDDLEVELFKESTCGAECVLGRYGKFRTKWRRVF